MGDSPFLIHQSIVLEWSKMDIKQEIGTRITVTNGREPCSPHIHVVQSNYYAAELGDKLLEIKDNLGGSIFISLDSLNWIVKWAQESVP